MQKQFLLMASGCLLANLLAAQDTGSMQSPLSSTTGLNVPNCADPNMAGLPECAGSIQTQNGSLINRLGAGQIPGQAGTTPGTTLNYSDVERFGQQNRLYPQGLAPRTPEPLTEFQRFVASTTGQVLPIYGANLFRTVPSTFAPLDLTPVPSDYVIGPDDELRIRAWGQVNFQSNLRVDRAGEIYLPQVGPVHVAGLHYSELDGHLRSAIGRVYKNFDLTADVGQIRAIQVYVSGQARQPGMYTISSLSTLVDAIFASGGPTVQGSLRAIEVRRNGTTVTTFDLYDLLIRGDKSKDVKLQSGDVIYIPPVGPQVAMTGSVRHPAIYELKPNETLGELMDEAGGASTVASESRILIERIDAHKERQAMEVAYDKTGLATPLADGDLVRVNSILADYQKTVILRGNLANPGRFAWHEGMHVSDLIPDKQSLLTRNYWWKRAQLGLPEPEFQPMLENDNLVQPHDGSPVTVNGSGLTRLGGRSQAYGRTSLPYGGFNPSYGVANQTYGMTAPGYQGMYSDQALAQGLNPQSAQAGLNQQSAATFLDQDGTQVDQDGSAALTQPGNLLGQQLTAQQRAGSSSLAEQETQASQSRWTGRRNRVEHLAPEIDWNYAVIERLDPNTLKTRLIPFDLGKLVLDHDASQDVALQPEDVVTIFSEADIRVPVNQQTKFVRLEGEFVHAGTYSVKPGETLRELVQRAGGITKNAYLYGSEFRRESTRAMQQARIDEYVQNLDVRIQHSNLALAASSAVSQNTVTGQQAAASEQELLNRLRQLRATGRIVLQFKPGTTGVSSIPNLALEDGDQFIIPAAPENVNVVGAVYDQNSFLYQSRKTVGLYLQQAGGPTKDADKKREFVIRADGEVVSYMTTKGLWGNNFENLRMYPGDTIVVPEKTFKPSPLRGVLDYSQLFSQIALGAASLTYLPVP